MNFAAGDVRAAALRLDAAHAPLVSTAATELPGADLGFTQGVIVRDPDGHASLIRGANP